jgi:hypothetical protein
MRRLLPFLLVAAASSLVTAGALAIPAFADEREESERPLLRDLDECLREHGFDLRTENGRLEVRVTPEGVWVNGEKVDAESFRKARRECRPMLPRLLPERPFDPEVVPPELRERMERFRDCLDLEPRPEEDL